MYTEQEIIDLVNAEEKKAYTTGEAANMPRIPFSELPEEWQDTLTSDGRVAEAALTMNEQRIFEPPIVPDNWRFSVYKETRNGKDYALKLRDEIIKRLPDDQYNKIKEALKISVYTASTVVSMDNETKEKRLMLNMLLFFSDFEKAWNNITKRKPKNGEPQTKRTTHDFAMNNGSIMSLNGHVATPSDKEKSRFSAFSIKSYEGKMEDLETETGEIIPLALNGKLKDVTELQTSMLTAIYQCVLQTDIRNNTHRVKLYLPTILQEMNIDPRTEYDTRSDYKKEKRQLAVNENGQRLTMAEMRLGTFKKLIAPFDNMVGQFDDGSQWRLCAFGGYDAKSETVEIYCPYIFKLREQRELDTSRHDTVTTLFHADIGNEPNWAAVELANRILVGIVKRGMYKAPQTQLKKKTKKTKNKDGSTTTTIEEFDPVQIIDKPNDTIVYAPKYTTLLEDCPQLRLQLEAIEEANNQAQKEQKHYSMRQAINSKLKQTFYAAFRIILEKSDAPQYYVDFQINGCTNAKDIKLYPTKSTLGQQLVITHRGQNTKYTETT